MTEPVADLLAFIDASPTPYHAVAESVRRLEAVGFSERSEADVWEISPGDRAYVVRNEGSLIAFEAGAVSPAEGGFRIVGAHTDSPNLRLKPIADVSAHGYRQLAVEPYGGLLLHTWLDRDLSIAGRVSVRDGSDTRSVLIDFGRPLLRVPNLAIHLQRELATDGLKLNQQTHAVPIVGLEGSPDLVDLLATELRAQDVANVTRDDILAHDLMLFDTQPSSVAGARGEFLFAPRLDNLASCHAIVTAMTSCGPGLLPDFTRLIVLYDHEEVGSQSAGGASSTFLADVLERGVEGYKGGLPQGVARAAARSTLISLDMTHAVHPNYSDKHEPGHHPVLGGGPVIKTHASQSYATDSVTSSMFLSLCERADVVAQQFVSRSDLRCGSTIGPISAARVGIRTVDVGNPMLSMHSCREMAATADVEPIIDVLRLYFDGS